jgi:hypothetical protein
VGIVLYVPTSVVQTHPIAFRCKCWSTCQMWFFLGGVFQLSGVFTLAA